MDARRHERLGEIFAEARAMEAAEREAYLARVCADDAALRAEVQELLAEDARPANDAVGRALETDEDLARAGVGAPLTQIGRYRILGIRGSGGMGTVYEAEQDSPARRVALKVIRADALSGDLRRRFRRETEILARLQHPGIAQIFEAGEFEHDGVTRPFFAMEFVDGLPLTTFARKMRLGIPARIDLFLQICDAIHYAHGQGVVHRDLKPDNILVQETTDATHGTSAAPGQPKILDFGVARLTDADARMTVATNAGVLLGSIAYMSPEQASGDVDRVEPRSDLYSLGVVLFELLSGRLPHETLPIPDALNAIRHGEPMRLGVADSGLRGDLDTILGKCLEKSIGRRYGSVAALADDLRRFRELKPISARPPSTWYQLQRFAQRNRALVGGAFATALALILGTIVAVAFAIQATRSAREANENLARSEREAYRATIAAASAQLETDPGHSRRLLGGIPEEMRGWEHRYLTSALSGLLLEFGEVAPRGAGRHNARRPGDMYLLEGGEQVLARRGADEFCVWGSRTGRVLRTFRAPGSVDLFAVAANGALIAAGLEDGRVVVCDPRAPEPAWATWDEGAGAFDALAVDPAGTSIAIDRVDGLRFGRPGEWHVRTHEDRRNYFSPGRLAYSPDGSRLAWLYIALRIIDVATGEDLREEIPSDQGHMCIGWSPDGTRVLAGQYRREIRAFDPVTGSYDVELLGHNSAVTGVAYGDGGDAVSIARDGTLRVWDVETRRQTAIFDAPDTSKAVFLDAGHVLSLTDGRFRLWQLTDRRTRELVGHRGHVFSTIFSGDGGLLASTAPWADIVIWDPLDGTPLRTFPAARRSQPAFSLDGVDLLASIGSWSRHLERIPWALGEPSDAWTVTQCLHHQQVGGTRSVVDGSGSPAVPGTLAVHRNEHRLGGAGAGTAAFINGDPVPLEPGDAVAPPPRLGDHPRLAIGPSHAYEAPAPLVEWLCFRGPLSAAHAEAIDGYLAARLAGDAPPFPDLKDAPPLLAHFLAAEDSIERSAEGHVLAWAARNDPELRLEPQGQPVRYIEFVPAGDGLPARVQLLGAWGARRWLEVALPAAEGADCLTVCWLGGFGDSRGLQTAYRIGQRHLPFEDSGRDERIRKVGPSRSFSGDGRLLADSTSDDQGGPVTLREVVTGHVVRHFPGTYRGIDLHPDGRRLACGGNDGSVDVYDIETGECLAHFEAHGSTCFDVAFSPDGERLASAGNDNALRLWSASTFEPLLEFPGHRSYVRGVAWSPDSTMLVSSCGDYTVRVWDSVPRKERYAQVLEARALEEDLRDEVLRIMQTHGSPEEALSTVRLRWSDDGVRLRAALRVMAREGD